MTRTAKAATHGAIGAKLMEYALKVRKVFVTGGVDEKMAMDVVQQLHILASISDDPIYMFVNSSGWPRRVRRHDLRRDPLHHTGRSS